MLIPDELVAALGPATQQADADRPIALPAGVWSFSRGSEPVSEPTIFSERLGISVSLLQLETDIHFSEIDDEEPLDTYDQFIASGQS